MNKKGRQLRDLMSQKRTDIFHRFMVFGKLGFFIFLKRQKSEY